MDSTTRVGFISKDVLIALKIPFLDTRGESPRATSTMVLRLFLLLRALDFEPSENEFINLSSNVTRLNRAGDLRCFSDTSSSQHCDAYISYWILPHICGDDGLPLLTSIPSYYYYADGLIRRGRLPAIPPDLRVSDDTVYHARISDLYEVIRITKMRQPPQNVGKLGKISIED
ncbi:hypothetical protein BDN71DRAFT_1498003 [Pleurotus eryngii]|uniref:Uncharacterized protein n=1 Tax=Pleurotus eryngii TaxID=5323 RepID=A0A9P5ZPG2_PLEER|nr:hypothetical protein BDN71DRAFT_1498003 [Pleurotus eryngii]